MRCARKSWSLWPPTMTPLFPSASSRREKRMCRCPAAASTPVKSSTWSTPRSTSGSPPDASPRASNRNWPSSWACVTLLVNSGSSANLLAVTCLTSPTLGERALRPGQEVITVAAGFPTTVNPIIQNGLVPVFVDVAIPTYDVDIDQLEAALSDRTRAVILAHTLGNPYRIDEVRAFCDQHRLWLIEDCCDALGSTYQGRHVGTLGDLATLSFYPAHHITMGEGGAVMTDRPILKKLVESFRDWGRDCWCDPGKDNTCGKRFDWQLGQLPHGYDHKYTYSHVGYNLKATDMQAAIGVAQLKKLPEFIAARKRNFSAMHAGLSGLEEFLILPEADARFRSVLVRFSDGGPSDGSFHAERVARAG